MSNDKRWLIDAKPRQARILSCGESRSWQLIDPWRSTERLRTDTHCRKSVSSHLLVDGWPGDNVFTLEAHRILPGDQGQSCVLLFALPPHRSWACRRAFNISWTLFKCIAQLNSTSESFPAFPRHFSINGLLVARLPSNSFVSMAMARSCVLRGCMHCNPLPYCPEWYVVFEPPFLMF